MRWAAHCRRLLQPQRPPQQKSQSSRLPFTPSLAACAKISKQLGSPSSNIKILLPPSINRKTRRLMANTRQSSTDTTPQTHIACPAPGCARQFPIDALTSAAGHYRLHGIVPTPRAHLRALHLTTDNVCSFCQLPYPVLGCQPDHSGNWRSTAGSGVDYRTQKRWANVHNSPQQHPQSDSPIAPIPALGENPRVNTDASQVTQLDPSPAHTPQPDPQQPEPQRPDRIRQARSRELGKGRGRGRGSPLTESDPLTQVSPSGSMLPRHDPVDSPPLTGIRQQTPRSPARSRTIVRSPGIGRPDVQDSQPRAREMQLEPASKWQDLKLQRAVSFLEALTWEQIIARTTSFTSITNIHATAQEDVARCYKLTIEWTLARKKEDTPLKLLAILPALLLAPLPRGGQSGTRELRLRCRRFLTAQFDTLWDDSPYRPQRHTVLGQEGARLCKAARFANAGLLHKATQALNAGTIPDLDKDRVDKLKAKYPYTPDSPIIPIHCCKHLPLTQAVISKSIEGM